VAQAYEDQDQLYSLTTPGTIPVSLATAKSWLKVDADADDQLLTLLLKVATEYAESYTRRDFRANTWTLLQDAFADRILLRRDPVASITSVGRLVSGSYSSVSASVYYLKRGQQASEVLLVSGEDWPSDEDDREHAIQVVFATQAHRSVDQARLGILRHVAWLYENRGDCDPASGDAGVIGRGALLSGATSIYDQFRVSRV